MSPLRLTQCGEFQHQPPCLKVFPWQISSECRLEQRVYLQAVLLQRNRDHQICVTGPLRGLKYQTPVIMIGTRLCSSESLCHQNSGENIRPQLQWTMVSTKVCPIVSHYATRSLMKISDPYYNGQYQIVF